jgi:hypothetical protein
LGQLVEHRPSILAQQAEIKDQDIWVVLVDCLQSLLTIATACNDVEVVFLMQEMLQSSQDEWVGVSDDKTDGHNQLQAA